jgi:plastocyanin
MRPILLLVLMLMATGEVAAQTGAIAGTIRYTGEVPPSKRIMATDGQILMHNDLVVQAKTKGLRDVIAVLDWKEKIAADPKAEPIVIEQRDMIFTPRVVTVQEGRKVRFDNNDNCNHAVDAASVNKDNVFSITTPPSQPYHHAFKAQKNPIPIGCSLHLWMRAYVLAAAHPYHAVTRADGTFKIDGVPAGKHSLILIHPDTTYRETIEIEVQAGKIAEVTREWKALK